MQILFQNFGWFHFETSLGDVYVKLTSELTESCRISKNKSIQILHLKLMINREKCLQKCLFLLCNALVDFSKDKRQFLCIVGFKFKEPCWIQLTSCEGEEVPSFLKGFYAVPEAFTILDFILKRLLQIALLRPLLVLMIYVLVSCWLIFH